MGELGKKAWLTGIMGVEVTAIQSLMPLRLAVGAIFGGSASVNFGAETRAMAVARGAGPGLPASRGSEPIGGSRNPRIGTGELAVNRKCIETEV